MLANLLIRIETLVLTRPRSVLGAALLLSLAAGWLGSGLELHTSRRELVPDGDANQARWDAVRADFIDPEPLIVAIERDDHAVPVATLERIAERVATRLGRDPRVSNVFYRVDLDWLSDHALHLAPPVSLREAVAELSATLPDTDGRIRLDDFAGLNDRFAARIEAALATGQILPERAGNDEVQRIIDFLNAQQEFLDAPEEWPGRLASTPLGLLEPRQRGSLTANGFLATDDGDVLFVLVHLAGDGPADLPRQQAIVSASRQAASEAIGDTSGVRFGLTGPPAMDVEEMAAIGRDGRRTSAIAVAGVFLLSLLAFHRRFHALLGLATLAVGVVWAIGAVQLELGYLNLITTALVPILVGMGIDYAVHPISQYELERRRLPRRDAVLATFRKTGRPVVVSALTTSAAFFCFLLMQFRGFAQLGLVTGIGVVLCLLSALLVLPALLSLAGRGHRENRGAAVDRLWDESAARLVCGTPRIVVGAALVLTLLALPFARQVRVNPDILRLLPLGAESIHYLEVMNERSALRNDFNLVLAPDLDALRSMRARAAAMPSIARFESMLTFLPEDPAAAREAVAEAAALLTRVEVAGTPAAPATMLASAQRLQRALADAAEAAFAMGRGELAGELEQARIAAQQIADRIAASGPVEQAAWDSGQLLLQTRVAALLERLRRAGATRVPTPESLPPALGSRFVTTRGDYVGYVYPDGDIYDRSFSSRFNAASVEVSSTAIGFPILFEDHAGLITEGFGVALTVGALLVAMLLIADLRSLRDTTLALVPVVLGLVWMLGLMIPLGFDFNFANLVAVPVVLGVGIDAGVHVVHRYHLERTAGMIVALAHTGRAILVASLTTMVGFGSLMLASHRGMASLGALLFLGVGGCLVGAVVVLPNLMLLLGLARR